MDPVTLDEMRESTADLIEEDPTVIALVRHTAQRTAAGGIRKSAPVPQAEKVRHFAPVTGDPVLVSNPNGDQVIASHVLIGLADDDIQENDTFTLDGRSFLISEIHPDRSFQTKAWVMEVT